MKLKLSPTVAVLLIIVVVAPMASTAQKINYSSSPYKENVVKSQTVMAN